MSEIKKNWQKIKFPELNGFVFDEWWYEGGKELKNFIESLLQQQQEEIVKEILEHLYNLEKRLKDKIND